MSERYYIVGGMCYLTPAGRPLPDGAVEVPLERLRFTTQAEEQAERWREFFARLDRRRAEARIASQEGA